MQSAVCKIHPYKLNTDGFFVSEILTDICPDLYSPDPIIGFNVIRCAGRGVLCVMCEVGTLVGVSRIWRALTFPKALPPFTRTNTTNGRRTANCYHCALSDNTIKMQDRALPSCGKFPKKSLFKLSLGKFSLGNYADATNQVVEDRACASEMRYLALRTVSNDILGI